MMNTKTQTIPFGKITIEIAPLFIIMLFKGNFPEKLGSQLNKTKQKGPSLKLPETLRKVSILSLECMQFIMLLENKVHKQVYIFFPGLEFKRSIYFVS